MFYCCKKILSFSEISLKWDVAYSSQNLRIHILKFCNLHIKYLMKGYGNNKVNKENKHLYIVHIFNYTIFLHVWTVLCKSFDIREQNIVLVSISEACTKTPLLLKKHCSNLVLDEYIDVYLYITTHLK